MTDSIKAAHDLAAEWLDGLHTRPVEATVSLQELRKRFVAPMPIDGTDPVGSSAIWPGICRMVYWVVRGGVSSPG